MIGGLRQLSEPRLRQQAGIEKSQTPVERDILVQWVRNSFHSYFFYIYKTATWNYEMNKSGMYIINKCNESLNSMSLFLYLVLKLLSWFGKFYKHQTHFVKSNKNLTKSLVKDSLSLKVYIK